jgi:Cys-rich protein (TIGR01571 family)
MYQPMTLSKEGPPLLTSSGTRQQGRLKNSKNFRKANAHLSKQPPKHSWPMAQHYLLILNFDDLFVLDKIMPSNMKNNNTSEDDHEPVTIRVIAPATLAEGYTFDVLVDDAPYTVEVPRGGVKEGQEFEVLYEPHLQDGLISTQVQQKSSLDTEEETKAPEGQETVFDTTTGAPLGRWRNPLCACCDVLTQSTFWMGVFCTPILIAQLITRLGLTWQGRTGTKEQISLSFNRIVLSMLIVLAFWKIPVIGDFALLIFWLIIVVQVGSHVRHYMRQKYEIPPSLPQRCARFEDGFCMCLCSCCSAIQMARHTHDDKEFPGHGCTTTGLGVDAPEIAKAV